MNKADLQIADETLSHQINLMRFSAGEKKKIFSLFLQLQSELKVNLHKGLTDYRKERINETLTQSASIIEIYYKQMALVSGQREIDILDADTEPFIVGRNKSKYLEFLTQYSAKELSEFTVRKVSGLDAGYAIKPDGDIINVFNNTTHKGMGAVTVIDAIQNGGKKLDCLDGRLVDLYTSLGFKEYNRIPFDKQYAPVNWDYEKYGTPDIVFLRHEGETDVTYLARSYEAKWGTRLDADPATAEVLNNINRASSERTLRRMASGESAAAQSGVGNSVQRTVKNTSQNTDLMAFATHEADFTAKSLIKIGFDASIPTEETLKALLSDTLLYGVPLKDWWAKQSADAVFKFSAQVRQGVTEGETLQQIITRIVGSVKSGVPGIMDILRRNASTLVHDSIMQIANDAHMATYQANGDIIKGYRQLSTLDGHTSKICIAYSGASWALDGTPINGTALPFNGGCPRHPNCRSVLIPLTKTYREIGFNIDEIKSGTRSSDLGQIPADTTFAGFLSRHSKQYQDKLLGHGRAELWRKGTITLSDLVSGNGREMTLRELKAL